MHRLAVLCLALAALLACAGMSSPALAQSQSQSQSRNDAAVARALLALHAEDLDGQLWTHADLRGRITLLDFWATWCAPCLRELPFLKRARELYGAEFQILGVSFDTFSRRELRHWMAREGVQWPQIHARRSFRDDLARAFRIDRLPTNFLLDQNGRVRAVNVRGRDLFIEIEKLRVRPAETDAGSEPPS